MFLRLPNSLFLFSVINKQSPFYDWDTDAYYLDINSLDFTGNSANTCSGILECRIPFYFENV